MNRVHRMLVSALMCLSVAGIAHADKMDMDKMAKPAMSLVKPADKDIAMAIQAQEERMNQAFKAKDAATCMSIADAGGMMIDPSGVMPVSAMEAMIHDYDVKSYSMDDYKVMKVAADTYIATYVFKADASYKGQAMPSGPVYCSTVWVKHGKDWKGVFHQESPAMPAGGMTTGDNH